MAASATVVVNLKGRKPQTILPGEVYCGRPQGMGGWKLKGSKFANPFKVGRDGTLDEVLEKYREYITSTPALMDSLDELRNKILTCWCAPARCHCDVLLELLEEHVEDQEVVKGEDVGDGGDEANDGAEGDEDAEPVEEASFEVELEDPEEEEPDFDFGGY